jgi:DNA-binding transcriptional LysR family regulator
VCQIHRGTAGMAVSTLARSLPSAAGHVGAIPITPPLHRDLSAVVAAGQPPTGAAQALLDLLAAGFPGDTR